MCSSDLYDAVPGILSEVLERFEEISGRHYSLVEYHGHPEADRVVVSELHRTVFAMSHFRRLSNGEIAERLGLTEGNVRVILCRLRREAKEVMKDNA